MCVCVYIHTNTHILPLFRVTQINTQSHTVSLQASAQTSPTEPDTGRPPPPQTQLFLPAVPFPKDWIPQLQVVGQGVQLHAQGSRSKGIQDGSHLLGQGTRKPHAITLAAPGQAMPAPPGQIHCPIT